MILVFVVVCGGVVTSMRLGVFVSAGLPTIQRSLESLVMTSIRATVPRGIFGYEPVDLFLRVRDDPGPGDRGRRRGLSYVARDRRGSRPITDSGSPGICLRRHWWRAIIFWGLITHGSNGPSVRCFGGACLGNRHPGIQECMVHAGECGCRAAAIHTRLTQFQTRQFQIWWYDRSTKEIAERLAGETRGKPPDSIRISATWIQQPALEFYRIYKNIAALQPIVRRYNTMLCGLRLLRSECSLTLKPRKRSGWRYCSPIRWLA